MPYCILDMYNHVLFSLFSNSSIDNLGISGRYNKRLHCDCKNRRFYHILQISFLYTKAHNQHINKKKSIN